ncbi:unnamed protein product [Closterium sp. NIES-65]|nr:unnamed protein product [Closterium sp. NIES-65]
MGLSIVEMLAFPQFVTYSLDRRIRPRHVALLRTGYEVVAREMAIQRSGGKRDVSRGKERSMLGSVSDEVEGVERIEWGAEEGKSGPLRPGCSATALMLGPWLLPDGNRGGVAATAASATAASATAATALPMRDLLQLFLWVAAVSLAVAEELLFRGLLLAGLQERLGRIGTAMLSLPSPFHSSSPTWPLGVPPACS